MLSNGPSTIALAKAKYRYLQEKRARADLMDFVPLTTREFDAPRHLAPLVDVFERVLRKEEVRAVISTPPQFAKSETSLHAMAWLLKRMPESRSAYATYAHQFAQEQNARARTIAERAGVQLESVSAHRWRTPQGGRVAWTGVGGGLTGHPIDTLLLCDDLLKSRAEAESPTTREKIMGWLYGVAIPRVHPGASIVLIATRWHVDDPSGQLIKQGWEHINLPAINDDNEPLWPEHRPMEWLEERRREVNEYDWWSLYMGEPRPRGGRVFRDEHYYEEFPKEGGFTEGHGFDAAYTSKTYADYSVTLSGRRYGDYIYLTDMVREQREPRQYIAILKERGIPEVTWFLSGTEKGLVDFMWNEGIAVNAIPATTDKFVRAQPAAADWNHGRVLLPHPKFQHKHGIDTHWVKPFLEEVQHFTGVGDANDDIIDALSALHYALGNKFESFTL